MENSMCVFECPVRRVACQELEDRIVNMESTYRGREADLHNLMSELKMDRTLQLELQRQQFQRALEVRTISLLAHVRACQYSTSQHVCFMMM